MLPRETLNRLGLVRCWLMETCTLLVWIEMHRSADFLLKKTNLAVLNPSRGVAKLASSRRLIWDDVESQNVQHVDMDGSVSVAVDEIMNTTLSDRLPKFLKASSFNYNDDTQERGYTKHLLLQRVHQHNAHLARHCKPEYFLWESPEGIYQNISL